MGHVCAVKLPLGCLGDRGDMTPGSPELGIHAYPAGQPGERDQPGPYLLARCQPQPLALAGAGGPSPCTPTKGELCCGAGGGSLGTMGHPTAQLHRARAALSQPFPPRGACTWGQPAGSCRCPWPPAPGTPPATTASSPGTPTAPGMAGPAAPPPPWTGRERLPVPGEVPTSLPPAPSRALAHHPVAQSPQCHPQGSGIWQRVFSGRDPVRVGSAGAVRLKSPVSCSTGLVQDIQSGNEGCRSSSGRGESAPPFETTGDAGVP